MRLRREGASSFAVGFSVMLIFSGGCVTSSPTHQSPPVLAYWQGQTSGSDCPFTETCFATRTTLGDLLALVDEQRARGLELVLFDAHRGHAGGLYAGAWALRDRPHVLEVDLRWQEFDERHRQHAEEGRRLVHLVVYQDRGRARVAAIWRSEEDDRIAVLTADPRASDKILHGLSWHALRKADARLRLEGYYLAQIEVYSQPPVPQSPWIAGVWRLTDEEAEPIETHWFESPVCGFSTAEIASPPGSVGEPGASPCGLVVPYGGPEEKACPALDRLYELRAEGFQPVDFEPYSLNGQPRLASLLHRRPGADWLMAPAAPGAVACRHRLLATPGSIEGPVIQAFGFSLFDIELLPSEEDSRPGRHQSAHRADFGVPVEPPTPIHNGLVHDGGTSGPPDDGPP